MARKVSVSLFSAQEISSKISKNSCWMKTDGGRIFEIRPEFKCKISR